MPESPLPEVAAFQAFERGRIWAFANNSSGARAPRFPTTELLWSRPWQASAPERIETFAGRLRAAGIGVTIRRNRGQEVGAACGQLAAR